MAGEMRHLTFTATTLDTQHWQLTDLTTAEASPHDDYDDWAFAGLEEAMRAAGQAYMDEHPDLFACELT